MSTSLKPLTTVLMPIAGGQAWDCLIDSAMTIRLRTLVHIKERKKRSGLFSSWFRKSTSDANNPDHSFEFGYWDDGGNGSKLGGEIYEPQTSSGGLTGFTKLGIKAKFLTDDELQAKLYDLAEEEGPHEIHKHGVGSMFAVELDIHVARLNTGVLKSIIDPLIYDGTIPFSHSIKGAAKFDKNPIGNAVTRGFWFATGDIDTTDAMMAKGATANQMPHFKLYRSLHETFQEIVPTKWDYESLFGGTARTHHGSSEVCDKSPRAVPLMFVLESVEPIPIPSDWMLVMRQLAGPGKGVMPPAFSDTPELALASKIKLLAAPKLRSLSKSQQLLLPPPSYEPS